MSPPTKIEQPMSRPGILDRWRIREANELLNKAEADLNYLANPDVKKAAGESGLAGAKLSRDGAQYAAMVRSLRNAVAHPYFGCFRSLKTQMEGVEKARGALAKDYQGVKAADTSVDVAGRRIAMRRLPDPNGGPEARNQRVEYNGQEYFVSASDRQWINQRATYTLPSSADGRPITVSSFKTGDYSLDPKTVDFIRGGKINGRVVYYDPRGVIGSYDLGRGAKFNYSLLPFEAKAGTRRVYLAIGGRNAEPVYVRADIANKYFDKAGGLKSEGMSSSVGIRKDGDRGPIERGDLI